MIVYCLLIAMLFVSVGADRVRRTSLIFISVGSLMHDFLMYRTPADIFDWYYFTGALMELSTMFMLCRLFDSKEVLRYNVFLVLCILGNFAGWLIWYFYLPSKIYNIYFIVLYAGLLITEGLDNVGGNRLYLPFRAFLLNGYQRSIKRDSGEN